MATDNTFTSPLMVVPPTPIGAGLREVVYAASFDGTNPTLTVTSPLFDVVWAHLSPVTQNNLTASTRDSFLLLNTMNASGVLNLIATAATGSESVVKTGLKFSRAGTNNQDVLVNIIGRG